jgi:protein ImuA
MNNNRLMPANAHDLDTLRRQLSALERGAGPGVHASASLGCAAIDTALGGGLARGALHEVFAAADAAPATGFALALALRAAGERPILWVRQDFSGVETGALYAPGLADLGLAPERLILVRVRDGPGVLRAAEEAARCSSLGAVVIEPWGEPRALDLTATRRLARAAETSGVPLIMLRLAASPAPSAATTRWEVRAAPSSPLPANAPGHPAFAVTLARRKAGAGGRSWSVEWNRDRREFISLEIASLESVGATLSGGVVSVPADGSPEARLEGESRRAG